MTGNVQPANSNPYAVTALVLGISKSPLGRGMSHWGLWLSVLGLVWPVLLLLGLAGWGGLLSL